jgi:hypothetical protein
LTTLFSYTWSKALDDGSAIRGPGNDFVAENARCRHCDYGYSTFDVPHRFVTSILYTLPFGKGQPVLNRGGVVNQILGGWQVGHDHHDPKRVGYGDEFLGFGRRGLLAQRQPYQLRGRREPDVR